MAGPVWRAVAVPASRRSPRGGSKISSFASGLEYLDGRKKVSFDAYRLPVWLPQTRETSRKALEVWGCARSAHLYSAAASRRVEIQLNGHTVQTVVSRTVGATSMWR